ncbi:S-adenosyl-L-methionine-dependent methyltransferase [Suillus clintonianus]|uniref:S-adenosyl-L-methionine-dependent methyltransferase n=1 Tax=Suillus clintonianus TaxID=1904413 RepID=UPI001B868693|nr:S-adenosyl-L-methionine-dependent methyltransferase [Suillus clintonianus]KAG2133739.1 S-adenosyl-L-methionine-dependent methyltransferase [Suillus clintonianus]
MSKKRHFGPMSAHASSSKTPLKRVAEPEPEHESSRGGKKRRKRLLSRVMDSDASEESTVHDSSVPNVAAQPQPSEPKELTLPKETLIYAPPDDEYDEDENFQVIGETDPAELSDSGNSAHVPVRILTDFAIYECTTQQLVPIGELINVNHAVNNNMYRASGYVKSHMDEDEYCDDDCDDDDDGNGMSNDEDCLQRIRLTEIRKFTIHDIRQRTRELDDKLYILTNHAWYILDRPSEQYVPFFRDLWLKHRVAHLLVSMALANPRLTYKDFVSALHITPDSPEEVSVALTIIGRELDENDIQCDDIKTYLFVTLDELRDDKIRVGRTPVVKDILGQEMSYQLMEETAPASRSRTQRPPQSRSSSSNNIEKEVLKHRNKTVTTPVVGRVAQRLFENIKIAGQLVDEGKDISDDTPRHPSKIHAANPNSVEWLDAVDGYTDFYNSVRVDGVKYSVGDAVIVVPGEDEDTARAKSYKYQPSQSTNKLANDYWFCMIRYFFEDDEGVKKFHAQWFTHSSKTLLQEAGHSHALYLMLSDCSDVEIDAISQKCNVRELPMDSFQPDESTLDDDNDFHSGLMFNSLESSFVRLSDLETQTLLSFCDDHKQCLACGYKERASNFTDSRALRDGFSHNDVNYHKGDFAYISTGHNSVYQIGQVEDFKIKRGKCTEVIIRLFGRYDDIARKVGHGIDKPKGASSDERRLFRSQSREKTRPDNVRGQCFVIHETDNTAIDAWVTHDDHFYVNECADSLDIHSLDDLQPWSGNHFWHCVECHEEHQAHLTRRAQQLKRFGPLRGLELFAGAGGLGTGLDMSGFVETRYAVEFSPGAAKTYKQNHPDVTVYNQCTNICLQHAIDVADGNNPDPLFSLGDQKRLPSMPKPGEVDFIYGGPPCQSFSKLNHAKRDDDIRSTLVCNMIAYVEFYRPMYFLLENVGGILEHALKGKTVASGVVKFILAALLALNYQIEYNVLHAGNYGAPQARRRVLFVAARQGVALPEFPIPTHFFPHTKVQRVKLPTGAYLGPVTRLKYGDNKADLSAPLHFVTIHEAIGDLPPFDWVNPHTTISKTAADRAVERKRKDELGIPSFSALHSARTPADPYAGYSKPCQYPSGPLSRYQKLMRQGSKKLQYHYTKRFGDIVIERTLNVPLRVGANHFDLPMELHTGLSKHENARTKYKAVYQRLDADMYFSTALTTVLPNNKSGQVLHPSQKRILTVRECARAQGFPDSYEFVSVNKGKAMAKAIDDQFRQIGNAVPTPLALALGKAFGGAMSKMWDAEPSRDASPIV